MDQHPRIDDDVLCIRACKELINDPPPRGVLCRRSMRFRPKALILTNACPTDGAGFGICSMDMASAGPLPPSTTIVDSKTWVPSLGNLITYQLLSFSAWRLGVLGAGKYAAIH